MIRLLHTNDLHGSVGMLPRLAALVAAERARAPDALLFDLGDAGLDGVRGAVGEALMRDLGYDGCTLGNHELEHPVATARLAAAGGTPLLANLAPGALPVETRPYRVFERGGMRVAVLGVTTPRGVGETPVTDPVAALRPLVARLRPECDAVVVLSHLGLLDDAPLAEAIPGIDLIVGAHSHHRLQRPARVGRTRIVQAGVGGSYLGVVVLTATGAGLEVEGRLAPVWGATPRPEAQARLERAVAAGAPLADTDGCWDDAWLENRWTDFALDAIRAAADCEVCLYKAKNFDPVIDPGPLRPFDLERSTRIFDVDAQPTHGVVRTRLPGRALLEALEHGVEGLPCDLHPDIDADLNLPSNNALQVSGLSVRYDLSQPEGGRVVEARVGGEPLDPERRYRVCTSSFLAAGHSGFGRLRPVDLGGAAEPYRPVGGERALVAEALRRGGRLALPPVDGRLRYLGLGAAAGSGD